jgi:signal transduction protein with GAF and PtsI domain
VNWYSLLLESKEAHKNIEMINTTIEVNRATRLIREISRRVSSLKKAKTTAPKIGIRIKEVSIIRLSGLPLTPSPGKCPPARD